MNFNQQNIERMHEESCKIRVIKTSISGDVGVESQFLEQRSIRQPSTSPPGAGACIFSDEDITVAGFPPNPWGTAFRPGACYGDRQSGAPKGYVFVGFITGKIVGLMVMKYKIMVRWGYNML